MTFGEIAWRPRLRQIGYAPKGEDWRCFEPGLNHKAGEGWYEQVELSLVERWHMAIGYGYQRELQLAMRDCDAYRIDHAEELFRFILHLPKPLAEILDDVKIPRTKQVWCFRYLVGPMPEFHGPLEPNGLLPYGSLTGNNQELLVQPSFKYIENLPMFTVEPAHWIKTLKSLVELNPLRLP